MGAVETLRQVRHKPKRTWSSMIPIGQWARRYDRAWLRPDVIAGPVRDLLKADGQAEKFGLADDRQSVQQVIAASAAILNQYWDLGRA